MYNTYHLDKNKERIEPVSPTNMFQDPNDPSTTWKDYERDLNGNIIYDKVLLITEKLDGKMLLIGVREKNKECGKLQSYLMSVKMMLCGEQD